MSSSEADVPRIIVCDDEAAARRGIVRALGRTRYDFVECASGLECLQQLEAGPADLVLLDLRMPGLDGRATLERIVPLPLAPPVIVVTADASLRTAIDAVKAGAVDFLAKPYEIEALRWLVERTLERVALQRENRRLQDEVRRLGGSGDLVGTSAVMTQLFTEIERVAPTTAGVLIRGETGTGKELVARRLHELSRVEKGPFVAVNCAAVPESLLESELFGHRRGAFTGADRDRVGRFQQAHRGTLFLDEIGDMPAAAQAKLLRVLQDGVVEPLGGGKPVNVAVRVLAATHRDLESLAAAGDFRQDLYYRLRVVELALPPLRERGEDVVRLACAFLDKAGRGQAELSAGARAALLAYAWPGNVRELQNAVERAAIFCRDDLVQPADLPAEVRGGPAVAAVPTTSTAAAEIPTWEPGLDFPAAKQQLLGRFERRYFTTLLEAHDGNLSRAARAAGIHRQSLQKKLRHLGLDADTFRRPTTPAC